MIKRLFLIALVCTTTLTFAQKVKLGHINSEKLLEAMPQRDSVQKVLTDYANQLQQNLVSMQQEYTKKVQEYQAKADSTPAPIKQSEMQDINDLQTRISNYKQSAQQNLQKKQSELLQPILDKAKTAIEEVAKANGFTYIFDSSVGVLLYDGGGQDILPLVMKKLNLKALPAPTK